MNKVVYIHRRLDNNTIFYVGMGNKKRVEDKTNRNNYWNNIVKKHGYYTQILADNLSAEDAFELEIFLISELGRKDLELGNLVNMTDGGDGVLNHSKESIDKIKKAHLGRVHSEKEKTKRANSLKGKKRTIEQRKTMSDARKGIVFSEEHLKNLSESHKGKCSGNALKVEHIETKRVYRSLREGCIKCNLKYKTEHMRMKRNPDSPKNNFKYV